ncbi:hypothetical protein GX888_01355 [Candidatus Dojkabacteria bacterium]|uniref:Terminase large subunit gp17-like C-terminal domain-containing protein n=1 Tax=Candidatus Dojkabacteria bacterium TaxID=2099670 RepID=A0A847VD29_9BACT|nr:hypothetical protein [Candidatus Dojkabacteria bacterium]
MKNDSNNEFTTEDIDNLLEDQVARRIIVKESHWIFFHLYFCEYTRYQTALFQKEMFGITESEDIKLAIIVAFRGSAKSTIMTMSYPIWAVLGKQQKKCVVILSQTQQQARIHLSNIKRELESNELLRADLGPFEDKSDEWGSLGLYIPKFKAKIMAASCEQSIRGIRHGAYRPDLIICDDVEDITSTKTKEGRERTYNWYTGEIAPLGERNTKIILVGNLLHEDSLLMRLKKNFLNKNSDVIFKKYPLVRDKNIILWPGKYSSLEAIEKEKILNGDDKAWQREYMLKIIADEDQIVKQEWIQTYEELPKDSKDFQHSIMGVDLAISKNDSADFTSIVTAHIFGYKNNLRVYIEKFPINERLGFPETIEKIKILSKESGLFGRNCKVYVEDVGYQKAAIQQLEREGVDVVGFKVEGQDKRARLDSVTYLIKTGKVLFPKEGVEDLLHELVYFGVEKHDDLVDAFTIVLHVALKEERLQLQFFNRDLLGL